MSVLSLPEVGFFTYLGSSPLPVDVHRSKTPLLKKITRPEEHIHRSSVPLLTLISRVLKQTNNVIKDAYYREGLLIWPSVARRYLGVPVFACLLNFSSL